MASIGTKEIERLLAAAGFSVVRQTGSHVIFRNAKGLTVPVPAGRKDMAIGTLKKIERITRVKLK